MSYNTNNDFADWIYNRYVEFLKAKDYTRSMLFLDVLEKYINTGLTERKFSRHRRYANALLKRIYKAMKTGKTNTLELTGKEWQEEFQRVISDYEKMLIDLNLPQEVIKEMVIEKKLSYGND
ncbi:MAG: hypothetical protein J7577_22935 [Sphingobacteriaceae bacterium]|nr:hypothetical protein [Sphingobacteriaceae bacterium]